MLNKHEERIAINNNTQEFSNKLFTHLLRNDKVDNIPLMLNNVCTNYLIFNLILCKGK